VAEVVTTHIPYSFDISEHFYVYLPVRSYELTLKNRLLDQLGIFSHLLLEALYTFEVRAVDWVLKLTGLNMLQLVPILTRLEGLELLKNGRLTKRGEKLAQWMIHLHNQTRTIWLDGDYKNQRFFGDEKLVTTSIDPNDAFVIKPWLRKDRQSTADWPCSNWNEDRERQRNRIMKDSAPYLSSLFESFSSCMENAEFYPNEWELSLRLNDPGDYPCIAIQVAPNTLSVTERDGYLVYSPVVMLTTVYSPPETLPASLRKQVDSLCQTVNFSDHGLIPDRLLDSPESDWIWLQADDTSWNNAVEFLFQNIAEHNDAVPSFYNRTHKLEQKWLSLRLSSRVIVCDMHMVGIHFIEDTCFENS